MVKISEAALRVPRMKLMMLINVTEQKDVTKVTVSDGDERERNDRSHGGADRSCS